MEQKTDTEQLRGILAAFNLEDITFAVDDVRSGLMAHTKFLDSKKQGEKCAHGQNGCIGSKEFEAGLEAVWGQDNLLSAHFLSEGAEVQKTVAMVTLKESHVGLPAGNGWGSGFLVSNSLFMTNNHVIEDKGFCDKVNMQFMYQDNYNSEPAISSEFFETNEDSFFHTNVSLDYTIVRLRRKPYRFTFDPALRSVRMWEAPNGEGCRTDNELAESDQIAELRSLNDVIARREPITALDPSRITYLFGYTLGSRYGFVALRPSVSYPEGLRLNIIQHPRGRKKEVVVQQNTTTDVHANVIHYYSDTDYGSSGSPVFNNTWDLMALHHARKPSENANEGIRIDKIVADLRAEFVSSNPGILTELGI